MPRTRTPGDGREASSSARRSSNFKALTRFGRLAVALALMACAVIAQTAAPARHTISGRLTDQDGRPIADAVVNLQGSYSETLFTDADGRYSRTLTAGGDYWVMPYKEGYVFDRQHAEFLNLSAPQTADFAGAKPGSAVSIGGRIVDGGGAPAEGITVRVEDSEGNAPKYVKTDADGRYRFDHLPATAWFAVVAENLNETFSFAPEWRSYETLVRHVTDADFVVTRLPRYITGSLTDEHGARLYPATVQLSGTVNRTVEVNETGGFFFDDLPQGGTYTVRPHGDGYGFTPHEKTFTNLVDNATADFKGGPVTNLALGREAAQSSTGWGGVASRATDGNTDGNWSHNSVTATYSDAQAWWEVDLGSVGDITAVKIFNRTDCCASRLSNFYVFVSDTPFESTDLTATLNQPGVWSYHKVGMFDVWGSVPVLRTGRYVRVQLAGTNHLSLAEVEVMGRPTVAAPKVPANVALGKAATQSSTGWGGVASKAADGKTDGQWQLNSVSTTFSDKEAWWEVDLGSVQQINTVKVWNRADCCTDRLANFYVLVSDAPFESQDLTATLNQVGVANFHTAGQAGRPTTLGVNRTGRYVRVQLAGTNYLSLAEVEVWGEQAVPAVQPSNLAFKKQTTQSSTGWGGASSRAVDAITDGDWAYNSVTTTLNDAQALWEVDLGSVRPIQNVKLWNRTDCCGERLSDFYVLVSDVPFESQDLAATLAQAGVTAYHTPGAAGPQAAVTVGRTGRYVRIQLAGTNYLSLAEVQVWGTP
ncbi:MAG TPA: discoidin domain-containing protein [Pyrinomonadaceae bacterium]|nr:discoidin domain-containing protein [Pyrinomonadaceae bacterium]